MARIHGTEMEWNILVPEQDGWPRILSRAEFKRYAKPYLAGMPHAGSGDNYFLGNGARLYGEYGQHQEYATPEDNSYIGTAANEIVGEQIIRAVLDTPVDENADEDLPKVLRYSLNKRVIDDYYTTSGYHESYAVNPDAVRLSEDCLALLGLHLATRSILTGAGVLRRNGDFLLAQKFLGLSEDYSSATTSHKPVVNTRDEPHADHNYWRRIHVISGDPNMSPWSTRVKLASTSLVLGLIENGVSLDYLRFANSLNRVGRMIASDRTGQNKYPLRRIGSASAVEVQKQLLKAVRNLKINYGDEELWAIDEWQRALDDFSSDPLKLADRADWAARYRILESYRDRRGIGWHSEQLRQVDRLFDDTRADGIGQKLRQSEWAEYMPPAEMIEARKNGDTPATRARIRGDFIKRFWQTAVISANWDFCELGTNRVKLNDPSAISDKQVEALGRRRAPALVA